ncbi:MAG TPA: energy-coupling factor ABC transporter permease [Bacillota bacterium]|mgnify:CR=1 FL=1|nr:energy-coupling factor ABC transporter permease [Bacillota bacterium]
MSHLHIPDGLIPLPWILAGIGLTVLLVCVALRALSMRDRARVVPRIATLSALMLLAMGLPIPVLGYHLNLTVLTGMIAGPAEGFIAALVVNLILALTAHGGITVVGLNALIGGLEVCLGWLLWRSCRRVFRRPFAAAAIATVVALLISTTAMLGIVAGTRINPDLALHRHSHAELAEHTEPADDHEHAELEEPADHEHAPGSDVGSLKAFAAIVYSAGAVGWAVEALVVGSIAEFITKSRPDMLDPGSGRRV